MSQKVILTKEFYPLICLQQAVEAFEDLCITSLRQISVADYELDIRARSPGVDERQLMNELLNQMLDRSVEHFFSQKSL